MKKWLPPLVVVGYLLAISLIAVLIPAVRYTFLNMLTALCFVLIVLLPVSVPIASGIGVYSLNKHYVENWVVKALIIILAGILAAVVDLGLIVLFTGFMPILEQLDQNVIWIMSLVFYGITHLGIFLYHC